MDQRQDHAIVLGGSMAGVLAARVLADRYRRVTVIDRDRFPPVGERRRGVPQDRHIHALQPGGLQHIEALFPAATDELAEQGAVLGDAGRDATYCMVGHRFVDAPTGHPQLCVSRPLLEGHLRQRLARLPRVELVDECDIVGLLTTGGGNGEGGGGDGDDGRDGQGDGHGRVTGVRVLRRRDGSVEERLTADLVVDATGRGSRLPLWLEEAGYERPATEETGLGVVYTTMRFPRRASDPKHLIIVSAVAPGRRGGGAIATEGMSWTVTLGGVLGEQAPTDPDGFRDYAATLAVPDLHALVAGREPLGEAAVMRYRTAQRRRYDRLERFPDGLVVLGDALCSFNPVYGQGMSVAAMEATALGETVDRGGRDVGRRFLAATSQLVDDAWQLAANGDATFVPPARASTADRMAGRYMPRVLAAAGRDPVVATRFVEVMGMVRRPPSLMAAGVAWRVLVDGLRHRRSRRPGRPAVAPAVPPGG